MLHYEILFLIIAFLMSGFITLAGVEKQYPAVLGDAANVTVQDLVTYTNMKRQANGLAPLKLNPQLSTAADQKARHMFAQNYWAHVAPDGTTPWVFIKDSGYQYLYAGENLARGFDKSSDVIEAWMNSPTHKENMLSPNYTDIGFAIMPGNLTGSDTILVVQMFGSPFSPKEETETEEIAAAPANTVPSPVITGFVTPGLSPVPTVIPSPTTTIATGALQDTIPLAGVAAIQSSPLLDTDNVKRNISFILLSFFIIILAFDAILIERKQIVRAFSHNLDHILFLLFILIAGIIIGKGAIV